MPELRDAQVVELFHLAFLQVLQARLDQARYVLKGGANLRYFFDSVRYSEDIDLDTVGLAPWALTEKVDGILASATIDAVLRSGGLAVEGFTKPKQTETTRRWKVAIAVCGRRETVRTKIEFSHRNGERCSVRTAGANSSALHGGRRHRAEDQGARRTLRDAGPRRLRSRPAPPPPAPGGRNDRSADSEASR
jgi:hypothetical protein